MASSVPSSFGLLPTLPQPPQPPQQQQAVTIRRRDARWGCSLCPGEYFDRKGGRFTSLARHVATRHAGLHWSQVVYRWGNRIRYSDGTMVDHPAQLAPNNLVVNNPATTTTTTTTTTATATSTITTIITTIITPAVFPPVSAPAPVVMPSNNNGNDNDDEDEDENEDEDDNQSSNGLNQTNISNINTSAAPTSTTTTTPDIFDQECLQMTHGATLYHLADQAFNETYRAGEPGVLRSEEEAAGAMGVYQDEKMSFFLRRAIEEG